MTEHSVPGTELLPWDYNKTFVSCRLSWQNRKTNLNLPKSASLVILRGNMPMSLDGSPWYTKLRASWWKDYRQVTWNLFRLLSWLSSSPNATRTRYTVARFLEHTMRVLYPPQLVNRRQFKSFRRTLSTTNFLRGSHDPFDVDELSSEHCATI